MKNNKRKMHYYRMTEFVHRYKKKKRSLIFYCKMKLEWGKEVHSVCCTRNERNGLAWLKTGIWKLRGMRRGFVNGGCLLCREEEDVIYILLLKCLEMKK
jgi:hypothetical protein